MPLTDIRSAMRIHVIMETRVPICGEYPFLGPITFTYESSEMAGSETRDKPETPAVKAAADFRKWRRLGAHSGGNMAAPFRTCLGIASTNRGIVSQVDCVTCGFPLLPSFFPFCLFPRGRRTAIPGDSWCRVGMLRCFSSAHPRLAAAGGWLPPGRGKSFSATHCGLGRGRLETAADIFREPDRSLSLRETVWRHTQTAIQTWCESLLRRRNNSCERRGQSRLSDHENCCRSSDASRQHPFPR